MSVDENSLKNKLNDANPNGVADMLRVLKIGNVLRAGAAFLRKKVPAASAYQLATLQAVVLADDAKAATVLRAYSRAGTVTGELTPVAYGATPTTGQVAVAPNGDIVVLAADAITSLDLTYQADKYDLAEITLPVATHVLTLTAALQAAGVVALLEAEALVGTSTGKKIVLVPGAGAPSAGQARLNVAKTTVTFAAADAVTSARVKVSVVAGTDVDALLTAAATLS